MSQRARISMSRVGSEVEHEQIQAAVGAWSTVILVVAVNCLWVVAKLWVGEGQLSGVDLMVFTFIGLIIIGWLSLLASPYKLGFLFMLLARITRPDATVDDTDLPGDAGVDPGRTRRALVNLWIPVTCQFWLVGWLIYASGGITSSPYIPVLVAMMIIGQSVYHVPEIDLGSEAKPRDVLTFFWRVAYFYGYPQLMFGSLLVALAMLQEYHPLVRQSVPIAETIFILQLSVSIGLYVAFVVRRVDRAAAAGTS